ncbi:beta-galactosidase-1-like protein 3 [Peromyscus eremicus]|uniref:beta-galactosidase-1-like protein 3 n=1 Tax=Peromyscus eremicus TaxID=42410 RepID=UPI0027DD35BD|nr:beta-galactosidase-1-like protein 3 [Peromyscus eremicus]
MAYLSKCLLWKRAMAIFFLPLVLSGLAPRCDFTYDMLKPSPARFRWSRLTPFKLKNRTVGLSTENNAQGKAYFTLEGQKFMIVGGSIHYFRVPREYWKDRLLKLQACGFNTVTTYIPWNLHEQERGKFDFSEILDLEAYVLLAATVGLWVILRPGPYICAEVDLGGLPSWLLRYRESQLRTTHQDFVEAVDKYFDHLIPRILPLQYRHGGPVIAVQVENEYGSFNKDKGYMEYIKKALLKRGIVEFLLTSDNDRGIQSGSVKGALATINMPSFVKDSFLKLLEMQNNKPIMVMEYWTGWYDTWGNEHNVKSAKSSLLQQNRCRERTEEELSSVREGEYLSVSESLTFLKKVLDHLHDDVLLISRKDESAVSSTNRCIIQQDHSSISREGLAPLSSCIFSDNGEVLDVFHSKLLSYSIPLGSLVLLSLHSALGFTFCSCVSNAHSFQNWHYGFVFINGRNLGRYRDIGPQRTLYLPGPWLHPEDNEIIVFEKIRKGLYIQTTEKPQLQN